MSTLGLSVVVPVFENTATLPELSSRLAAVLDDLPYESEVIFVDDGSRDASPEFLAELAERDPRVRVVRLARNFGGQAALCAGFEQVRGRRTVCLDADLENFPEDIPPLLAALDRGYDLACGVRQRSERASLWRRSASAVLNAYVRHAVPDAVSDIGCGMRAMDTSVVRGMAAEGERRRMLSPLLIARASSVVEVPIRVGHERSSGGHGLVSLAAIAIDFFLATARRPFLVCGLISAFVTAAATVGLVSAALCGAATAALFACVFLVGGALGLLASLVGEYAQRAYELQQGRELFRLRDETGGEPDVVEGSAAS